MTGSNRHSLGDGVSSVSGEPKGRGIILNEMIPSGKAKPTNNPHESKKSSTPPRGLSGLFSPRGATDSSEPAASAAIHTTANVVNTFAHAIESNDFSDISQPYKKKSTIKPIVAERLAVGSVSYSIHHVTDYQKLKKVLGISASISSTVTHIGGISSEMSFAENITLTRENVTLIVIGERISHIDTIPKHCDLAFDQSQLDSLEEDTATFKNSNGDHYVSSIKYGEKFFAEIKIMGVSSERGEEFRQCVEAKVHEIIRGTKFGVSGKSAYKKNELLERSDISIQISYCGLPDLGFPGAITRLEDFVKFVSTFNDQIKVNIKKGLAEFPIGHTTEPYVTLVKSHAASQLYKNVEMAKELLREFDTLLNRVRMVMPTASRIVEHARELPRTDQNTDKINRLNQLYLDATLYQKLIQTIILKIDSAQTDLSTLKLRLTEQIEVDKRKMNLNVSSPLVSETNLDEDEKTFDKRDRLLNLSHVYMKYIYKLEADIANVVSSLQAAIYSISFGENYFTKMHMPNDKHFHIRPPTPNTRLLWKVEDSEGNALDQVSFNVCVQKRLRYKKDPLFVKLRHGSYTEVTGVLPSYRYKIDNVLDRDGNEFRKAFKVTIYVCGDSALRVRNDGIAFNNITKDAPDQRGAIEQDPNNLYIANANEKSTHRPRPSNPGMNTLKRTIISAHLTQSPQPNDRRIEVDLEYEKDIVEEKYPTLPKSSHSNSNRSDLDYMDQESVSRAGDPSGIFNRDSGKRSHSNSNADDKPKINNEENPEIAKLPVTSPPIQRRHSH